MISNFSSSLFNLGIILIVFSAIVYIVKTKLTEMDKKISSLSSVAESVVSVLNDKNTTNNDNSIKNNPEKTLVSDDEDDEDEGSESDSDDGDDEDDGNSKFNSDIKEIVNDDTVKLDEVELLRNDEDPEKSILGMNFKTYDSIDDNMEAQKHAEQFSNSNLEAGIFSNDEEKEKDTKDLTYSSMTVKELKKIVSEKGGKISGKSKDELLAYLNNN